MPNWKELCRDWYDGLLTDREFVVTCATIGMVREALAFLREMACGADVDKLASSLAV